MGVENHAAYRINLKSSNYDKIAIDVNSIINVLNATSNELLTNNSFKIMKTCTSAIKKMQRDDHKLLENVSKNEQYLEDLRNRCEEERLYNINTIEETNNKIQKLKFDVEEVQRELTFFNNCSFNGMYRVFFHEVNLNQSFLLTKKSFGIKKFLICDIYKDLFFLFFFQMGHPVDGLICISKFSYFKKILSMCT